MSNLSVTAFKKLSVANLVKQLPIVVFSSNKPVYQVMSLDAKPTPTPEAPLDLLSLVLAARNDDGRDPVHRAEAQNVLSKWLASQKPPTTTTPPVSTPSTPLESVTVDISKPNWLGDWSGNVRDYVAEQVKQAAGKQVVLLVPYNIPGRDNGNYSAGGLHSAAEYDAWITEIAKGIGESKCTVILEPDAIGLSVSLFETQRQERYAMLNKAVTTLKWGKNTKVYVDSSMWLGVDKSAEMLAPIKGADGFSCNVSGYQAQQDCINYGVGIYKKNGMHFVIDTSRNGNGAPHGNMWCNQTDTKVGVASTYKTGIEGCDAFLWIKVPGESDGLQINGDGNDKSKDRKDVPSAGVMWPEFRDAIYSGDWKAFKDKYNV